MTAKPNCPHCGRFLSIPEFIDKWCEPCAKATNVKADAPKRAA